MKSKKHNLNVKKIRISKKVKFVPRPPEDPEVIEARWQKKKDRIHQLANNVSRLKLNVTRDLKSEDEKEFLTALVIAIMMATGERVGNDDSAANGHLGVTGFQKRNVKVRGNEITLKYTGKSGVEHEKVFKNDKIASAIKQACKKSRSRYLFETSEGQRIRCEKINLYLKEFSINSKDIRGHYVNRGIVEKLSALDIPETEKDRKKLFNQICKKVANNVGHGAPTCKKHYIVPELPEQYITHGKIIDLKSQEYYKEGGSVGQSNNLYYQDKKVLGGFVSSKNTENVKQVMDEQGRKRFEIDDLTSKIDENFVNEIVEIVEKSRRDFTVPLSKILYTWDGYTHYPELKPLKVRFTFNEAYNFIAAYLQKEDQIIINVFKLLNDYERYLNHSKTLASLSDEQGRIPKDARTTQQSKRTYLFRLVRRKLFHELSHAIQKREGIDLPPTQINDIVRYIRVKHDKFNLTEEEFRNWLSSKYNIPFESALYLEYKNIPSEKEAFETERKFLDKGLNNGGTIGKQKKQYYDLEKLIETQIKKEREQGKDYPPSVAYKNHLQAIKEAKDKKEILSSTKELDDYLKTGDKYAYIIQDKDADEIRDQLFSLLREKRREVLPKYDYSKVQKFLDDFIKQKSEIGGLKYMFSDAQSIIDYLKQPELIGLYEETQFPTLRQNIAFDIKTLKRKVKQSGWDYYIEYFVEPFEKLLYEAIGKKEEGGEVENDENSPNNEDFADSKKISNFIPPKITKDELRSILSGTRQVTNGRNIQAAFLHIRGKKGNKRGKSGKETRC